MMRLHCRTAIRLVRSEPASAVRLLLLSVVLSLIAVMFSGAVGSYYQAVRAGAAAAFGGYIHQVSGPGTHTQDHMRVLESEGRAVAVMASQGTVHDLNSELATTTAITYISGESRYGELLNGQRPRHPGEISVSVHVADQLGAGLGDTIELHDPTWGFDEAFTLVGVTRNPALVEESSVVAVRQDENFTANAQAWLTDDDLVAIETDLSNGNARISRLESTTQDMVSQVATRFLSPVVYIRIFGAVLILTSVTGLLLAHRAMHRRTYVVLTSLGDSPLRASATAIGGHLALLAIGGMIGGAGALLLLRMVGSRIGALVGQHWRPVTIWSLVSTGALTIGLFAISCVIALLMLRVERPGLGGRPGPARPLVWRALGLLGVVITVGFVIARELYLFPLGHYSAMISGALSVPALVLGLSARPSAQGRGVTRSISLRGASVQLVGLAVVFASCFYASLFSATAMTWINWGRGMVSGTSSYLSAQFVTDQTVSTLGERFPDVMADALVFADPDESSHQFRVVAPQDVDCLTTAGQYEECLPQVMSTVALVFEGTGAQAYAGTTRPDTVSADGRATVVLFSMEDGSITEAVTVSGMRTAEELGNDLLPGLVVLNDSEQAHTLGLTASHMRQIVIPGFARFDDETKNEFRSALITAAPFATIAESDSPEFRQLEAMSITRGLLAVLLSGTMLLVLSVGLVEQQREARMLDVPFAGGWRFRLALVQPLLAGFTVCVVSATLLGRAAAMDRIPLISPVVIEHDYGSWWLLPLMALGFLALAVPIAVRQTSGDQLSSRS